MMQTLPNIATKLKILRKVMDGAHTVDKENEDAFGSGRE